MTNDILDQVCDGLDMLNEDVSIPRNIRRGADEVKNLEYTYHDLSATLVRFANSGKKPGYNVKMILSIVRPLRPFRFPFVGRFGTCSSLLPSSPSPER